MHEDRGILDKQHDRGEECPMRHRTTTSRNECRRGGGYGDKRACCGGDQFQGQTCLFFTVQRDKKRYPSQLPAIFCIIVVISL